MKNELLSIAEYIESLEQRIVALETREAALQQQFSQAQSLEDRQVALITALEARIAQLETAQAEKTKTITAIPTETPAEDTLVNLEPLEVLETVEAEQTTVLDSIRENTADMPQTAPEETIAVHEEPATESAQDAPVKEIISQEPEPVMEAVTKPQTIPTQLQADKPHHTTKPVQTSLFGAPVQDIRRAISLGDRFLFQRELFAGSAEKMQQTIETINSKQNFDEALAYIQTEFQWDKTQPAYELFINVLHRRFG